MSTRAYELYNAGLPESGPAEYDMIEFEPEQISVIDVTEMRFESIEQFRAHIAKITGERI